MARDLRLNGGGDEPGPRHVNAPDSKPVDVEPVEPADTRPQGGDGVPQPEATPDNRPGDEDLGEDLPYRAGDDVPADGIVDSAAGEPPDGASAEPDGGPVEGPVEAARPEVPERPPDRLPELTDTEYVEHVKVVDAKIRDAQDRGLTTDVVHTTDPERETWTSDRYRVQREIMNTIYDEASAVPNAGEAVIAGGLGGAGKSTVLGEYAGIDQAQYLTINPDDVKEHMAARGLLPDIERLSPMEASTLAHEESSLVANRLAQQAYAERKNVIWDITMSSPVSVERRIDDMREAGYERIDAVFVDIPVDVSVERAMGRHRRGLEEYRNGEGHGGRYVPDSVIRANDDPDWGSRNRATFEALKDRFDSWRCYDNSRPGEPPRLIDSGGHADDATPNEHREEQEDRP